MIFNLIFVMTLF